MAITDFIPEIWSARFRTHFDSALVYAQPSIANRNWEGEIREAGDTVHIFKIGDPTIKTYVPGTDIDDPENPDGTDLTLVVDQKKYFNIAIDDVYKVQTIGNLLDRFAERAARGMRATVDAYVSAALTAAITAAGAGSNVGTNAVPVEVKADGTGDLTPYELAVELRKRLNDADAPSDGRWLVINPDVEAEFLLDEKFIGTDQRDETRTGQIGRVAGFDVMVTTDTPQSAGSGGTPVENSKIIAGAGDEGITFADQLVENEAYRPEKQFADAWRGLEVYGAKVVETAVLAQAHVSNA